MDMPDVDYWLRTVCEGLAHVEEAIGAIVSDAADAEAALRSAAKHRRLDRARIVKQVLVEIERKKKVAFSNKYYNTPAKFVCKKGAMMEAVVMIATVEDP